MKQRPILLFDVMDTLVYNPFNREVPEFFGLSQDQLIQAKDPTAWPEFERGWIDEAEYFRRYFRDRRSFDQDQLRLVIKNAYDWLDGADTLLGQLSRAGFEMHALSNYPVWYRTIEDRLHVSRYLQWTFVSCLTGIRKPASDAFLSAAQTLGRSPDSCLLIDDRVENCDAATAVGMPSIHFVGTSSLSDQLQQLGHPFLRND